MKRSGLTRKEAWAEIQRLDNERASYYRYYTDQTWSSAENYDLCVNTASVSYEDCADIIIDYLHRKCK